MQKKKSDGGGDGAEKKKEESPVTVVLKIDMHCEGCASKIVKTLKGFQGNTPFPTFIEPLCVRFPLPILISRYFLPEIPPNFAEQCSFKAFHIWVSP